MSPCKTPCIFNFFNQINGLSAAFRIIPSVIKTSEELGIPPIMNQLALKEKGLVLLTGPTGSGKTTTLYSILNYLNDEKKNILTAEDPIEYELEGISQSQINSKIKLDESKSNPISILKKSSINENSIKQIIESKNSELLTQLKIGEELIINTNDKYID